MNKKSIILVIIVTLFINACAKDDNQINEEISPSVILHSNTERDNVDSILYNEGKTIAIIGDSYSTYGGWIPSGYPTWYAIRGKDGDNKKINDVNSVKLTWWWKLCYECGFQLLMNSSYGGSPICNTGYNKSNAENYSFITRAKRDIGVESENSIYPDIIIIFGGTNDSQASVPLGSLKYEDWTEEDLKSFCPHCAICMII